MKNEKFEIIESNQFGRRKVIRFKQYKYIEPLKGTDWIIKNNGCAPTSLAIILATLGYDENPVSIAETMLLNEYGLLSDSYNKTINNVSVIYCLNKLIEKYIDLSYKIIKINYDNPNLIKNDVINMIKNGYMALVNVGPGKNKFCSDSHYFVITSVNNTNNEFYIANSWYEGAEQKDQTFSYEQIVEDIYIDSFDFLMIKRESNTTLKKL